MTTAKNFAGSSKPAAAVAPAKPRDNGSYVGPGPRNSAPRGGVRSRGPGLAPFHYDSVREALVWMSCVVALQTCVDVEVRS